jgi:hypothetical protein
MNQALYAHMNNKRKMKKKRRYPLTTSCQLSGSRCWQRQIFGLPNESFVREGFA